MNDFIIVEGHLGISNAILHLVDEYGLHLDRLDILAEPVSLHWGSDIDDGPIDEEFRYRWASIGEIPLSQVQAEVNRLRRAIAVARQKYLDELNHEIIAI